MYKKFYDNVEFFGSYEIMKKVCDKYRYYILI